MSEPRIVIVGFPSAQILDITGPLEVFSTASRFLPIPRYATELVSTNGGPVLSTSGLEFATEPIDQVVGTSTRSWSPAAETWMKRHPTRSWSTTSAGSPGNRVASHPCARAPSFLPRLGCSTVGGRRRTGRNALTWNATTRRSPSNPTPSTCRMATSGPQPASPQASTSRSPSSPTTTAAKPQRRLLAALSYTSAAPADRHSSPRCSPPSPRTTNPSATCSTGSPTTSPPTFPSRRWRRARTCPIGSSVVVFKSEVGITPAEHVEAVRMEAACRLLETTLLGIEEIARACGYGTPETMNRAFRRRLNTTPGDHRHHFGPVSPASLDEGRATLDG